MLSRQDIAPTIEEINARLDGQEDRHHETIVGLAMILAREFGSNPGVGDAGKVMDSIWGSTAFGDLQSGKVIPELKPGLWKTWDEVNMIAVLLREWIADDMIYSISDRKLKRREIIVKEDVWT